MSTYREAIHHARAGGTTRLGGKEIRFLTFEEAEPFILEHTPSVRTIHDEETGKPIVDSNGKMVIEMFADPRFDTKRLGLYDVSDGITPFMCTDEDIYEPVELDEEGNAKPRTLHTNWVRVGIDDVEVPAEVVAPEVVDEVLHETVPHE